MDSNYQTHTVNILYKGHFEAFVRHLEVQGIKTEFVLAGLRGSQHSLIIKDDNPLGEFKTMPGGVQIEVPRFGEKDDKENTTD